MKKLINKIKHHKTVTLMIINLVLFSSGSSLAQTKTLGDPATCPLCNPPLRIIQLRAITTNLHEFPAVHLEEGQVSENTHTIKNWNKLWVKKEVTTSFVNGKITLVKNATEDSVSYEPYKFVNAQIDVAQMSTANTLISAEAYVSESYWQLGKPRIYTMRFRAGAPGKPAVAWLIGKVTRQHLSNKNDTTELTFIQPVVVHPSPVPLFVQEISIPSEMELKFRLEAQKNGEIAVVRSSGCGIRFNGDPYDPAKNLNPHHLPGYERNCGALASIYIKESEKKWKEIKRVLVIVNDDKLIEGWDEIENQFSNKKKFYPGKE